MTLVGENASALVHHHESFLLLPFSPSLNIGAFFCDENDTSWYQPGKERNESLADVVILEENHIALGEPNKVCICPSHNDDIYIKEC